MYIYFYKTLKEDLQLKQAINTCSISRNHEKVIKNLRIKRIHFS